VKSAPDCIPCILRQVLNTARKVSDDAWLHRKILNEVMQGLARTDFDRPPAELVTEMQKIALRPLGTTNPFAADKVAHAQAARAIEDRLREAVAKAPDPLAAALRIAGGANVLDAAVLGPTDLAASVDRALARGFALDDTKDFKADLEAAKTVLVLGDSAGEIILDRILLERLAAPGRTILYAVRGGPILNDATREDAQEADIAGVATVVDTGVDELGCQLGSASQEFRARFEEADLVLSKGAANFETIGGESKRKYYLVSVKCAVVARHFGVAVGDVVFMRD